MEHACSVTALEHGFCLACRFDVPEGFLCSMTRKSDLNPYLQSKILLFSRALEALHTDLYAHRGQAALHELK